MTAPHESRLRSTAGLAGFPPRCLSSWRGRSGRKYSVQVYDLTPEAVAEICDLGPGVLLAVRRDDIGVAVGVEAVVCGRGEGTASGFAARGLKADATELHVHRAETAEERRAVCDDLDPKVGKKR